MKFQTEPKKDISSSSLSGRIAYRLTIPLFVLAAVFAALLLNRQITAANELNRFQSQLVFQVIHQSFSRDLSRINETVLLADLGKKIKGFNSQYQIRPFDVYDATGKKMFFEASAATLWDDQDYINVEESLVAFKESSKPFLVKINSNRQFLTAYIPFKGISDQILVARVSFPLTDMKQALLEAKFTLFFMLFFITLTGWMISRSLAKSIVRPIKQLNEATQEIMQGHLGKHVEIHTGDEIQTLAETFNKMSDTLIQMKERAEDANPLTQLPGNQAILHELQRRIYERQKFVLFHVDLDRFKVFNDHFGLALGDKVIKKTAQLLREAVRLHGSPSDFIGHQGGDDYVLITRPNHAKAVAEYVCKEFDTKLLPEFYKKEDLDRGFILEVDRRNMRGDDASAMVKFPLMAITLAGISTAKRDFADYYDCMNVAVEVKKEAKKTPTSSYLIKE